MYVVRSRYLVTVRANIDTCVKLYLFMCLVSQLYSEKYSTNHSLLLHRWRCRWHDIHSLLILHMRCCFSLVFSLYGINLYCIVLCSNVLSNAGLLIHAETNVNNCVPKAGNLNIQILCHVHYSGTSQFSHCNAKVMFFISWHNINPVTYGVRNY